MFRGRLVKQMNLWKQIILEARIHRLTSVAVPTFSSVLKPTGRCFTYNNCVHRHKHTKTATTTTTTSTATTAMESLGISDFKILPCTTSKYIVPTRLSFKQNGVQRYWDYIKSHDSVAVLIYNKTKEVGFSLYFGAGLN